jgi:succinate dehydrogenase/fumarate reductase flavoprotein subunit
MNAAWDVVILGSGVAGLAAALAAQEMGLRPLVLERLRPLVAARSVPTG